MSRQDIALAVFSQFLFGLTFVLNKIGVETFPPLLFCAMRFALIIPFAFFFPKPKLSFSTLFLLALLIGCCHVAGQNIAMHRGVSASTTLLISQSSTFIIFLLSAFFINEKLTKKKIIGLTIGIIGIYFICKQTSFTATLDGFSALFIAIIGFSTATIIIKKAKENAFHIHLWLSIIISPILFGLSLIFEENQWQSILNADKTAWGTLFFTGWGSMFFGAYLWLLMIKKYELSIIMPYRLLVPIFGSIMAMIILGERFTSNMWIGASLICLGLVITQQKSKQKKLTSLS